MVTVQYQLNKLTNKIRTEIQKSNNSSFVNFIKNLHDIEGTKYLLTLGMYKEIKKINYSHVTDIETRRKLDKVYTRLGRHDGSLLTNYIYK